MLGTQVVFWLLNSQWPTFEVEVDIDELLRFDYFVFDGDGTVFDTNQWKYRNILEAVKCVRDHIPSAVKFADKFIHSSGVPREDKIFIEFGEELGMIVLEKYNLLNMETIEDVTLVPGIREMLEILQKMRKKTILFSAGSSKEIDTILYRNDLKYLFNDCLLGADKTVENLRKIVDVNEAIYFGDALRDYLVAAELGIFFVYVNGYILKSMEFETSGICRIERIKNYFDIKGV